MIEKIIEVTVIVKEDKRYCSTEIQKLKEFIIKSAASPEKRDVCVCMTLSDCLRFVHCLFEDEVLSLYEDSQTLLTRDELDAKKFTLKKFILKNYMQQG